MRHFGWSIEHGIVHIHIDHLGAVEHLAASNFHCLGIVFLVDKAQELAASRHIASLTDIEEISLGSNHAQLIARKAHLTVNPGSAIGGIGRANRGIRGVILWLVGEFSWLIGLRKPGEGSNMLGSGAAATTHDVHKAFFKHGAHMSHHSVGRFVVAAHLIGQTGIGIYAQRQRSSGCKLLNPRQHTLSTKSAVKPHAHERSVSHTGKHSLYCLSAERATTLCKRHREHHRHLHSK